MKEDFLDELAELALSSRLKRLSENMSAESASIFRAAGFEFQTKWFTLFALLHKKQQVNVVEAAEYLRLSQPAVSQFCKQLKQEKLIIFIQCSEDNRKRNMSLSRKGRQLVEQMLPLWQAVDQAAKQLCHEAENDFYQALVKLEQALQHKSLSQRALEIYHAE